MKKHNLALLVLASSLLVAGCTTGDNTTRPLVQDGKSVLFSINGTNYFADDLFGIGNNSFDLSMLDNNAMVAQLYTAIENAVVEASQPVTTTISNAAELEFEAFEEDVRTFATQSNLSVREARALYLEDLGFETVDDLKASYVLAQQKAALIRSFNRVHLEPQSATLTGVTALERYVDQTNPLIVSHILIAIANKNDVYNKAVITEAEADKLGNVCNRLSLSNKETNKFTLIAGISDDGSFRFGGNLGIMDSYTRYVSEFKFGVYSALASLNLVGTNASKVGIDSLIYNQLFGSSGIYANNQVNRIQVDNVCADLVNLKADRGNQPVGATSDDANLYPRNKIFNQHFNFPGVQFLTLSNSASTTTYPTAERSLTAQGIVTDNFGNPIVVTRSEFGIHFIAVNYNSFNKTQAENTNYFRFNSTNVTGVNDSNNYVLNTNYVGFETLTNASAERSKEVSSRVDNFLKGGFESLPPNQEYLNFAIFKYFFELSGLEISNPVIKDTVMKYIGLREKGFASSLTAFRSELWQEYILNLEHDKVLRAQIYR
jgi:predicted small secreted protein